MRISISRASIVIGLTSVIFFSCDHSRTPTCGIAVDTIAYRGDLKIQDTQDGHKVPDSPRLPDPAADPARDKCKGDHPISNVTETVTGAKTEAACERICYNKIELTVTANCVAHCPTHSCEDPTTCLKSGAPTLDNDNTDYKAAPHAGHFDCRCWAAKIKCPCDCF